MFLVQPVIFEKRIAPYDPPLSFVIGPAVINTHTMMTDPLSRSFLHDFLNRQKQTHIPTL